MSAKSGLRPPTPTAAKPLPVIHQQLGPAIPLTFFKLYAPSYRCPRCGLEGLFVKVSASDGNALMEFWDIEGPRADFTNMQGLELHQGIGARGGFRYEQLHESSVVDHLDIFGEALVRTPRLLSRLPTANLFLIDRQAPAQSADRVGSRERPSGAGSNPALDRRTYREESSAKPATPGKAEAGHQELAEAGRGAAGASSCSKEDRI